jgi:hypothetical protein
MSRHDAAWPKRVKMQAEWAFARRSATEESIARERGGG